MRFSTTGIFNKHPGPTMKVFASNIQASTESQWSGICSDPSQQRASPSGPAMVTVAAKVLLGASRKQEAAANACL